MWPHGALQRVDGFRRRHRVLPWLVVVAVMASGMWRVEMVAHRAEAAAGDAQQALVELKADRRLDVARACVQSWEGRLGVRELLEAILAAAAGADPAAVAALRADVARRLPDPACDRGAAQAIVDNQGG